MRGAMRDEVEPLCRPAPELAVRMGNERRSLPDRPEPVHGQEDLVLTAAPRAGRVYVNENIRGSRVQGHQAFCLVVELPRALQT